MTVLGYNAPQLATEIARHQAESHVPFDAISLRAGERPSQADTNYANMIIRQRGAYVIGLSLLDPLTRTPVEILHMSPDPRASKAVASHGMMPFGASEEAGGQHGPLRWLDYDSDRPHDSEHAYSAVNMNARTHDLPVGIERSFRLSRTEGHISTHVRNWGDQTIETSMGEHLYFDLPRGASAHDVNINGGSLDAVVGRGTASLVDTGRAVYWPGHEAESFIEIPDKPGVILGTRLVHGDASHTSPSGAWIWRRNNPEAGVATAPFICIEPVVGADKYANDYLAIRPNQFVTLATRIALAR